MPETLRTSGGGGGARARPGIILCADDYAMTNGISRSIVELAEAGRLSATSALTTSAHWPSHATWIARVRDRAAVGLHLNLTLGAPLGAMAKLAPSGRLPGIGDITALALRGTLDRDEIAAEIDRQLVAFEAEIGLAPDHLDGHQHVHVLPIVRDALADVLAQRYGSTPRRPLVRDPADTARRIVVRGRSVAKALAISWLARGFGRKMRALGFATNDGFAGVTDFNQENDQADFSAALKAPGPRHLVMCHPGFVDDELTRLDPVTTRRRAEHETLAAGAFAATVWRPERTVGADPIDWPGEWQGVAFA